MQNNWCVCVIDVVVVVVVGVFLVTALVVIVVAVVVSAAVIVDVLFFGCESRSASDRPCEWLHAIGVAAAVVRRCGLCCCWFRRSIVPLLLIFKTVF